MSIKRYDLVYRDRESFMKPMDEGDYVTHNDLQPPAGKESSDGHS